MLILALAFDALAPEASVLVAPWAEFRRYPALRGARTKVEVGTLGYDAARKQLDFWLRRTENAGTGHEVVTYADTRSCPPARSVLASMRDIPVPKFAPVGSSKGPPIWLDGIGYSLRTYSDEGHLTAETNMHTPLAAWIDQALKALDSCWVSAIPKR